MSNQIHQSYICSHIGTYTLETQCLQYYMPIAGDVGLFQVEQVGKDAELKLKDGSYHKVEVGEEILCAFSKKYSWELSAQKFAGIQERFFFSDDQGNIEKAEDFQLILQGTEFTSLKLKSILMQKPGSVVNTKLLGYNFGPRPKRKAYSYKHRTFFTISTHKREGAEALLMARKLVSAGHEVAYVRVTGAIDSWLDRRLREEGITAIHQPADLGFPPTRFCNKQDLSLVYHFLLNSALRNHPDYIIIEVAKDALVQRRQYHDLTQEILLHQHDYLIDAPDEVSDLKNFPFLNPMVKYNYNRARRISA